MHLLPARSALSSMILLLLGFLATAAPLVDYCSKPADLIVTKTVYTTITSTATNYAVATTTTRAFHPVSVSQPTSPLFQKTVYVTETEILTTISDLWPIVTITIPTILATTTATVTVNTTVTKDIAATTETIVVVPSTSSEPPVTTVTIHVTQSVTKFTMACTYTTVTLSPVSTPSPMSS